MLSFYRHLMDFGAVMYLLEPKGAGGGRSVGLFGEGGGGERGTEGDDKANRDRVK
jgi:hypothetical protein